MERLINSAWHVQRPRRDVVATAAPLARGRADSRRFFRESADNVRLDPQGKLTYVGDGDGALAVIDPQQMKKIGDVKLDGHPEAFQLEQNGPRNFINDPTAHQVAVVDRERMTVIAKWDVKAAASNLPMALDEGNRRLFIGCRNPATLVVLDIDAGKSVASVDCCGDTDDLFYDPHVKRLYITGGAGCITAIHQTDADHYRSLGNVRTASGARTCYFDSDSQCCTSACHIGRDNRRQCVYTDASR